MASWREAFDTYRQPRLLAILFMGFSSGLPLPLTLGTLSFWLAQSGVSRTAIGLFALVGISYNFKFLWSPIIDTLPVPVLTRRWGRRRSWALAIQGLLAVAIFALGLGDPGRDALGTALVALIAAGAGALYAAAFGGWSFAYALMSVLMGVGMVTVWFTPEPDVAAAPGQRDARSLLAWLREAVVEPLADFLTRPLWAEILVFIVLYKFGDALAGVMANPLYVALHFTEGEVASVSKIFGVLMTLVGLSAGGVIVARLGLYPSLLICGVLQNVSTMMYAALALAGHDMTVLAFSIAAENVTGGMGSAAFVAYLSRLCNVSFTATQYALLSSLAAVGRTTLSASGGWLVDQVDWVPFFSIATVAGFPALFVLLRLMRRVPIPTPEQAAGVTRTA